MNVANEPHKDKLLIVDDEPRVSKWLAECLERMQYRYVFVNTFEEANVVGGTGDFDTIVYGHEFLFAKVSMNSFETPKRLRGILELHGQGITFNY